MLRGPPKVWKPDPGLGGIRVPLVDSWTFFAGHTVDVMQSGQSSEPCDVELSESRPFGKGCDRPNPL